MEIKKVTVDLESGRFLTGGRDRVLVTVRVLSWDAPEFAFKQECPLDSFETHFDRIMEMGRRSILAEVARIKKEQMPYEERLVESLAKMKARNEGRVQGA